jgi:hypothetical protein
MNDIKYNSRDTRNVYQYNSNEPHQPMSPKNLKLRIHKNSPNHNSDENAEHHDHSSNRGTVEHIRVRPRVYEIEHLVSCHISVSE